MNKKYLPSAIILYLNYFIHGIGCSILSQQLVKELLAEQWGMSDVMGVTAVAAALGLGRLISLPFAGPLSDKFGRRVSVLIGCFSYVTMGIKLFISVAQLLLSFFLGICVGTSMSYLTLPLVCGIVIAVLGVLAIFAPLPKVEGVGKGESFINNLKSAHFSLESVALILIGFTCTATFQLWLNCAQTFGTDVAGIASEDVSMMQTYYSAGTLVALFVTSILITKFKQVRFLVIYPVISLVMLVLVYMVKSPLICYVGAFVIGYAGAGGVLQMVTAVANDLFPKIKGTLTSLVMIASSLCNYTILTAASNMSASGVIVMNIVITIIGIVLAVFVNVRYGVLLKNADTSK